MTIILSQNEIRAEAEKAFRGVGIDWGMAKDGGVIAAWMAAHNLPFLGTLNRCLEGLDGNDTLAEDRPDCPEPDCPEPDCTAPFEAIARAEFIAAVKTPWSGYVLMPRFLLAGLGIVAQEQHQAFTLRIGGKISAVIDHDQVWITPNGIGGSVAWVEISPHAADQTGLNLCPWSDQIAHQASASCWKKLGQYASRTYVPETEEKRAAGAGAGDIDNN